MNLSSSLLQDVLGSHFSVCFTHFLGPLFIYVNPVEEMMKFD